MKKICSIILCICLLLSITAISVPAATLDDFASKNYADYDKYDDIMPYRLYVPADYDPQKSYPLVLFLHGAGERGSNNNHLNSTSPLASLVSAANLINYPCIIVAPQCPADAQWVDTPWTDGSYSVDDIPVSQPMSMVMDILEDIRNTYNIDSNRNYAIGISMGGYGVWDIIMRNPDMFAAAMPICGSGDPSKAELIKDMPIWTFHGDADPTVPVEGTRSMVAALESAGANIKYTEYSGVEHKCWTNAYAEPEFFGWLFSQTKAPLKDALYLSEHFNDGISEAWNVTTNGEGNISAEGGIVNIAAHGGNNTSEDTQNPPEQIVIEKGKAYVTDAIGATKDECTGWTFNDVSGAVSVKDGIMTFAPATDTLAQAEYYFTPDTNTFVTEFEVRLNYDEENPTTVPAGVQIFDGTYRNYVQLAPSLVRSWSNPTVTFDNSKAENGVWYTYRMEQSAGHLSIMRKAEGADEYEILGENLIMNTNGGAARFKFYIEKVGLTADIRNVQVHSTSTRPIANKVYFGAGAAETDTFEQSAIADTKWATTSQTITLSDNMLNIKANGTAAQSVTKTLEDFSKLEFEMRYRINNALAAKSLNIGLLNKTHRAVISVYPAYISMRSQSATNTAGAFYNAKNITTQQNTWYTLKVVMELYDEKTQDYRYSVYRKADGDEDYTCVATNLTACTFASAKSYVNLYVEGNADNDCSVDYVKTTTYQSSEQISESGQSMSINVRPDGSYLAEFKVRLNHDIASNGANIALYNGGYRVFMRIQPNRVTLMDKDDEVREYDVENEVGQWYTYLFNIKDFSSADVYRKAEGEAYYTKIIDNQTLQIRDGRRRAEIFVEGNSEQDIDVDYLRVFKGVVIDNKQINAQGVAAADILNGTDSEITFDVIAASYSGGSLEEVNYASDSVGAINSKTISAQTAPGGDSTRLFVWDSVNKMTPVSCVD